MSENPVVLVTGAGRRIGAAIARQLHAQGWRLLLHARREAGEVSALAAALNAERAESAHPLLADLLDPAACRGLVEAAAARWGRLDALVNNASSYRATPLATVTPAQIEDLVGSNLRAPLLLAQAATRQPGFRAIVNLLDVHVRRVRPGFSAYLAAKAGLWTLTEVLALELAPQVRVNAVAPGHMIWASESQLSSPEQRAELARIPLARLGGAEPVAQAVAFLLSPAADYLTGVVLPADGGLRLA